MSEIFKSVSYWKIIFGLLAGAVSSYWVTNLQFGNFITLVITACLFFGLYGGVLLVTKERLTVDIFNQLIAGVKKKIHKDVDTKGTHNG